jgi:multidrug efflux pump subunit AcrB
MTPHRRDHGRLYALAPVLMTAGAMILGMIPMALASAKGASRTRRWHAR